MPNDTYGGVRGKETKVGQKNFRFPTYSIDPYWIRTSDLLPVKEAL